MAFGKIKSFSPVGLKKYDKETWEKELLDCIKILPGLKIIKDLKVDDKLLGDLVISWVSTISSSFVISKTLNKQTVEKSVTYHHLLCFSYNEDSSCCLETVKDWYWFYKSNSPFSIYYTLKDDLKERGLML